MSTLDNMAHASNERRNQNIMKLRQAFNDEKYNTISQAARGTGYTYQTVKNGLLMEIFHYLMRMELQ